MDPATISPWSSDWAWSLPIIVMTVVIHSYGLGEVDKRVASILDRNGQHRLPSRISVLVMGGTALCATILHGFEAAIWAAAFLLLGAVPDRPSAMLYSLGAMTTYGHTNIHLALPWQLMGTLEALNGWILFGLSTAFLFTVMYRVWPHVKHAD
jgi:hypothetical protein